MAFYSRPFESVEVCLRNIYTNCTPLLKSLTPLALENPPPSPTLAGKFTPMAIGSH